MRLNIELKLKENGELQFFHIVCDDKKELAQILKECELDCENELPLEGRSVGVKDIEEWLGNNEYMVCELIRGGVEESLEEIFYKLAFPILANLYGKRQPFCDDFSFGEIREIEEEDLTATSKKGGGKC